MIGTAIQHKLMLLSRLAASIEPRTYRLATQGSAMELTSPIINGREYRHQSEESSVTKAPI